MKKIIPVGSKVGIVCCSNGLRRENRQTLEGLRRLLQSIGLQPVVSKYIFAQSSGISESAVRRAEALMEFYQREDIAAIFDISGGDLANEILPYLDYAVIAASGKSFWGYSDLTAVINAIYSQTGRAGVLYQVRNLVSHYRDRQCRDFCRTVFQGGSALYDFAYQWIQGEEMAGIVVGGNIRCLLKLAGTKYFPEVSGNILLLESMSGDASRITAYFSQLQQMGVFERVSGLLLGTFTEMEQNQYQPTTVELLRQFIRRDLPVIQTRQIGHGMDSKGIPIGEEWTATRTVPR